MDEGASTLARASGAVRGKGFFRKCIKLAGVGVTLDRGVELPGAEEFEPRAKPRQLARGKLLDGILDFFGGGHVGRYSICARSLKRAVRGKN